MKIPVVDLSACIRCGVCVEVSPAVFKMNNTGFVEILPSEYYPEDEVEEAIKNCPTRCIYWDEA